MNALNISQELVDAKQQSIKTPDTFEYPAESLKTVKKSDCVKICHNAERFWVTLTEVYGDSLVGLVNNDLVCEHQFKCDDKVSFEKRHVYQVYGDW